MIPGGKIDFFPLEMMSAQFIKNDELFICRF